MAFDREEYLNSLGDRRITLSPPPNLALAFAGGYYMLGLFIAPAYAYVWRPENENVRLLVWLLLPLPIALIAWLMIQGKKEDRRISFDQKGFQIATDHLVLHEFSWARIKSISALRNKLRITRTDGSVEEIPCPWFENSREAMEFRDLIKSFVDPSISDAKAKKWFWRFVIMTVLGIAMATIMGRPSMLRPEFEGTIGPRPIIEVAIWCIAFVFMMIGSQALFFFLQVFMTKKQLDKERKKNSRFGPCIRAFLDENRNWPRPIELQEGLVYRYIDPDGVRETIKGQVISLWITVAILAFMGMSGIAVIIFVPKQRTDLGTVIFVVMGCAFLLGLAIFFVFEASRRKLRYTMVDDRIQVRGDNLVITRKGQELMYPRSPKKVMNDAYPQKETKRPFGKTERYGDYVMDRRYLAPVDSFSEQEDQPDSIKPLE